MGLSIKEIKFVRAFCETGNATRAAIAAGYSEDRAQVTGSELVNNGMVAAKIAERHAELAAVSELDETWVLNRWRAIAAADPAELTAVRYVNCRYCRGVGGKYQWTENEYFDAVKRAAKAKEEPPECDGGFGYDQTLEPVEDCAECNGQGELTIRLAETNQVRGAARQLFAGVKQTKNGIEILMRDQDAALANISKYLGMAVDRQEISGPRGGPMATVKVDSDALSDEYLEQLLAKEGAPHGALQPRTG